MWVAVGVGAFLLGLLPIADGDIFWHLAAGRAMLRARAWLRVDPFTLSAGGRAWPDVHWLFQLAAVAVHRATGLRGLIVVKSLLVALGAVLLTETTAGAVREVEGTAHAPTAPTSLPGAADRARALGGAALLATSTLTRHLVPVRPTVVTLVMLALFFATLESHRHGGSPRRLLLLPIGQLVWCNCQGLSVLGPLLVAAYLAPAVLRRARRRRAAGLLRSSGSAASDPARAPAAALAVVLGLCLVATLATPYGLAGAALPGRLLLRLLPTAGNVFSVEVAENASPLELERTAPDQVAHFRAYAVVLLAGLLFARRHLPAAHGLVVLSFATLALLAARNVPLFYWLATPIAAMAMARRLAGRPLPGRLRILAGGPAGRAVLGGALGLVLAGEIAWAGLLAAREPTLAAPAPFHFPVESVRVLRDLEPDAATTAGALPVFAPDHQGGYLELFAPGVKPYLDTRLILHTAEEYAAYLAVVDEPARFDALAAGFGFRYVVLTTAYPDRYLALVRHLARHPDWRLIFTDGSEVLFARGGPAPRWRLDERATTVAILDSLARRFRDHPRLWASARLELARLLIVLEETGEALHVLSTLDDPAALRLRARAHLVAGELAAAEGLARTMLATDGRDLRSLVLLAQLRLAAGDREEARRWLRAALDVAPFDPEARAVLARLEAMRSAERETGPRARDAGP